MDFIFNYCVLSVLPNFQVNFEVDAEFMALLCRNMGFMLLASIDTF